MENASKALIIAASVLMGVVILSLAVYLFATFSATSNEIYKQMEDEQLQQFNSQFTSYEGRQDLTIYDVITVTNLANDNNKYYELENNEDGNYYITVKLKNNEIQGKDLSNYLDISQNSSEYIGNATLKNYTCTVTISEYIISKIL